MEYPDTALVKRQQASVTPSLPTSPKLPDFVDPADLDAEQFFMPTLKRHHAKPIQQSADAHRRAMAPAQQHEQTSILSELRLRTIPRTESPDEARARHRLLLDDLADVPADILQAACRAFVNAEGSRFYPTAGELRTHINPLIAQRRLRAYRLAQMAREAEGAFDEERRWRPKDGETAAIKAEFGIGPLDQETRAKSIPTVEDYLEIGVPREDAERIVAQQKVAASRGAIGESVR